MSAIAGRPAILTIRQSTILAAGALLALAVAAIVVTRWLVGMHATITTDDAYVDAEQRVVTARTSGRVLRVTVALHDRVRAGDVLAILDDRDERARAAQAHDNVEIQRAALAAAEADMRYAREQTADGTRATRGDEDVARLHVATVTQQAAASNAQVGADRAAEAQADAQLAQARADLPAFAAQERRAAADRASAATLLAQGYTARSSVDASDAAYARAHADVERARQAIVTAEAALVAARAKTAQDAAAAGAAAAASNEARQAVSAAAGRTAMSATGERERSQAAHVAQLAAALDAASRAARLADEQLADVRVRAPVDGWVATRTVNDGVSVAPSDALFTLVPERGLYVTANFKETQVGTMHVGDAATIHVDTYGGTTFSGHVAAIGASTLNMTSVVPATPSNTFVKVVQRLPVRIALDTVPAATPLRPGMSVEVSVARR